MSAIEATVRELCAWSYGWPMGTLMPSIITGSFTLVAGMAGILLTGRVNRRTNRQKQADEDDRRWLNDRRQIYAQFLSLCESLLRQADSVAVFMSYDGEKAASVEDEEILEEGHLEFIQSWEERLQPVFFEVQLMASPHVAELADRVSGAILELETLIGSGKIFVKYYPTWFQARDLVQVLRNSMREELNLLPLGDVTYPRSKDWPWLADRPPREAYFQGHTEYDR